jgi:hypothetical protein
LVSSASDFFKANGHCKNSFEMPYAKDLFPPVQAKKSSRINASFLHFSKRYLALN